MLKTLKRDKYTIKELADRFKITQKEVRERLREMIRKGIMVERVGNYYHIPATPVYKNQRLSQTIGGTYSFGFCGDSHLCSKYERLDILNRLYDAYEERGVEHVYHTGNWVDGEARFNIHDLHTHGIDNQLEYLAANYPQRDGITTYAIAGDDHEGWYTQKMGIDIGRHAESFFRDYGRTDWVDLGYMESVVKLGKLKLMVMHPGGGSAYAISYRPQKIVESFDEANTPDILLIGHYHKLSYNKIRGVHAIQTGCTQDQTPFMRKKIIAAHLGGGIAHIDYDGKKITRMQVEFIS